jgi:hypothetical protein
MKIRGDGQLELEVSLPKVGIVMAGLNWFPLPIAFFHLSSSEGIGSAGDWMVDLCSWVRIL